MGRLSGFKGDTLLIIVEKIFPKIFEQYKNVEFHIIGGMNEKSKIIPAIERTNRSVGTDFIIAKGFSSNVEHVYRDSDLIVGSGRVAMEALACGSPVVSIGESNDIGIISSETEREALITNFGDLDARRPIDVERSVNAILSALEHPELISGEWGRKFIESNFEINNVSAQINVVYAEAIAKKKGVNEIPVLSYQRITNSSAVEDVRAITVSEFERQLEYLTAKKFTALNFYDMAEISSFKRALPEKPVILTFESYDDNFTFAYPLLKKYGCTGIFFLQTNLRLADGKPALSFDHAKVMRKDGYEIGSASHSSPKMNLITNDDLAEEITGSKLMIENSLETSVITFAYPAGFINEKIKQSVKKSGYIFAVTIDEGRRNFWTDFLKIRRIQIFRGASKFSFWKKTSGRYLWYKYVY